MVFEKRLIPIFMSAALVKMGLAFILQKIGETKKIRQKTGQIKEKGDFYEYTITGQKS
ncbi:hypothetical protein [Bacillus timonensis]|uniref:hypothetical protein n=1 Tax=Bacillus timonensis TaxID=1033734 RepID=UPI00030CFE4C|nr:hypothetical protein [Bacillus timonensis]